MAFLKFLALFALIAVAAAKPTLGGCEDGGLSGAPQVFQHQGDSGIGGGIQNGASFGVGAEKSIGGGAGGAGVGAGINAGLQVGGQIESAGHHGLDSGVGISKSIGARVQGGFGAGGGLGIHH